MNVSSKQIEKYILDSFSHVNPLNSWGELSFFINPNNKLKRGTYFATLKLKDGENDSSSNLNRDGIFRLNIGLPAKNYISLFGEKPKRPAKGCVIEAPFDFSATNIIMPHPVYGWMGWICVLNPDQKKLNECKIYLKDAYDYSYKKTLKKLS